MLSLYILGISLLINSSNISLYIVVCDSGKYGVDCLLSCHCADRAAKCDNVLGCVECNPGWEGEQCMNNTNDCESSPCPVNSEVCEENCYIYYDI